MPPRIHSDAQALCTLPVKGRMAPNQPLASRISPSPLTAPSACSAGKSSAGSERVAAARLGSGQRAYAATPLGFYLGCLSVHARFHPPALLQLDNASLAQSAPAWLARSLLGLFALQCALGMWLHRGGCLQPGHLMPPRQPSAWRLLCSCCWPGRGRPATCWPTWRTAWPPCLPLLWPHAWVGVAVMAATVAALLAVQRGLHRRAQTQRARSGVN